MTEHRALERLVRDRMARTGESYTTAHRHVVGRRAPAPDATAPGLLPGYRLAGSGEHAPSTLVARLLGRAGVPLSEPMACGLGGGVGFLYAVFEYAQVPHPLLTIVAQHHPQPWLDAAAGRAALVTVARGGLPWHRDAGPEEAADPYPVVVAGRRYGTYLVGPDDDPAATFAELAARVAEVLDVERRLTAALRAAVAADR